MTVTTWVLATASATRVRQLLLAQSTNLHQLEHDPVRVLISSAFWLSNTRDLVVWVVLFSLVAAPVERWLGTGRWILTFAVGHVVATLVAAGGLWLAIHWDLVEARLGRVQDVGASYGFFAVAAVGTFALHGRPRIAYTAALWLGVAAGVELVDGVAVAGHAIAVLLGYACGLAYGRPTSGSRGS